jgi:hypothetical protein
MRLKVVEIVGLNHGSQGRACGLHAECGRQVHVGSVVIFRSATVTVSREVIIFKDIHDPNLTNRPAKKRGRPKALQKEKVTEVQETTENAIKVLIWENGVELCTVGFVSKAFVTIYGGILDGRVAEVTEVHDESEFQCERTRSREQYGLARATILG